MTTTITALDEMRWSKTKVTYRSMAMFALMIQMDECDSVWLKYCHHQTFMHGESPLLNSQCLPAFWAHNKLRVCYARMKWFRNKKWKWHTFIGKRLMKNNTKLNKNDCVYAKRDFQIHNKLLLLSKYFMHMMNYEQKYIIYNVSFFNSSKYMKKFHILRTKNKGKSQNQNELASNIC